MTILSFSTLLKELQLPPLASPIIRLATTAARDTSLIPHHALQDSLVVGWFSPLSLQTNHSTGFLHFLAPQCVWCSKLTNFHMFHVQVQIEDQFWVLGADILLDLYIIGRDGSDWRPQTHLINRHFSSYPAMGLEKNQREKLDAFSRGERKNWSSGDCRV